VFQGSWRKTGCQFSFACDGRPDIAHWRSRWLRAQQSAAYVWRHQGRTRSIVRGATFYHTKFVHPRWDKHMVRVARIGLHIFYRPRRGRLS
jgi:spore germination cell wall hydrolase CwlJ-like protein